LKAFLGKMLKELLNYKEGGLEMLLEVPINTYKRSEANDLIPGIKPELTRGKWVLNPKMVCGCIPDEGDRCVVGVIGFDEEREVLLSCDEFCKRWRKALVEFVDPPCSKDIYIDDFSLEPMERTDGRRIKSS
jgi:hypothetical protein